MQTVYQDMILGFPGQRMGLNHEADSMINDLGSLPEIIDVNIDTALDATAYTFTVNGVSVSITSGTGATAASIRDQLVAQARTILELEGVASFNPSGDSVRVTGAAGVDITVAESSANMSTTSVQAFVAEQPIPFGRAVVKRTGAGTTDQSCMLPSAASQIFLGVAERIHSNVDATNAAAEIAAGQVATIGRRGDYVVEVEEAIAYGDPAFFRHTAGAGGSVIGRWRNDADTASADEVTGARFVTSTTGAGLAVLRLDT